MLLGESLRRNPVRWAAAAAIRSFLIGACYMSVAEHREPYEPRGSRTDLGARGGEIPLRDSPVSKKLSSDFDRTTDTLV
jgi:hypothetical protein